MLFRKSMPAYLKRTLFRYAGIGTLFRYESALQACSSLRAGMLFLKSMPIPEEHTGIHEENVFSPGAVSQNRGVLGGL
jgi:hypothetical protein